MKHKLFSVFEQLVNGRVMLTLFIQITSIYINLTNLHQFINNTIFLKTQSENMWLGDQNNLIDVDHL